MQNKSDVELLREYAANGSEAAFGEIVRRYSDFVYSAALRQTGNPEGARDVAQTVFTDLARKAGKLRPDNLLIGWLCRGARLAALAQLRSERRRMHRERQAMELHEPSTGIGNDWEAVRPVLDEAIAGLGEEDRNALLLRYFQNESLTSVGVKLGVSEDAAQKRVSRALGKLRELLAGRGINTSAAALSVVLTANGVQAAPVGFAASLTASALTGTAAGGSTALFSKLFTLTNMKTAMLVLALVGGIVALGYQESKTQTKLREARDLTQRLAEEIEALRAANAQFGNQASELEKLRGDAKDVLRMRAEIAQLRREQAARKGVAAQIAAGVTNNPPENYGPPILITGRFISVPTDALKAFGWLPATANAGGAALMDDSQVRAMIQDLEKVEGMELISTPRIQTASDVEAGMSASHEVTLGGTNVNVGVNMNVNPHYTTNSSSITLALSAELNEIVDNSVQQDESQRDLRNTAITNSVALVDGQSVLLRQDLAGEGRAIGSTNPIAGPKSLLLCVTPHILREDGSYLRLEKSIPIRETKQ